MLDVFATRMTMMSNEMNFTRIARQLQIVALGYTIFLLATGLFDAFVQIPALDRLIFRSVTFHVVLFGVLWIFAALVARGRDG